MMTILLATLIFSQTGKPFLDQTKTVPAGHEWNREVASLRGGDIRFLVNSPVSFSVIVVRDRTYKEILKLMKGEPGDLKQEDVLLNKDFKPPMKMVTVTLPPGSSWFMIRNNASKPAELRLRCWNPSSSRQNY
jgi:hypothetical protein